MITIYSTGKNFYETLKTALKSDGTPDQVMILDAKDVCFDFDDNGNLVLDVKQVAKNFELQVMFHKGEGVKPIEKPVYRFSLNYHPDDIISNILMLEDAKEFLNEIGFSNTQYVIVSRRDKSHPYVKIIANIIDNNGERISTYRLINKIHQVAAIITKSRGYIWGEKQNIEK